MDAPEVDDRLADFMVKRQGLVRIGLTALGARNDSLPYDDPKTAKGQFAYIYGVRTLRQVFRPAGYEAISSQNIESVYDSKNQRKIMFQSVDCACIESRAPKAISEIGSGKELVIENAQTFLFKDMEDAERERQARLTAFQRAEAWYLCVAFVNNTVSIELSRPRGVENKQFADDFVERIFILRDGDGPSGLINLVDDLPPIEIKPIIIKR